MRPVTDIVNSIDSVPVAITHGLEVGTHADGSFEYHYNFLDYVFGDEKPKLSARSYLGEDEAYVHAGADMLAGWPLAMRALIYLNLRYGRIKVTCAEGYEPLEGPVAEGMAAGVRDYLAASVMSS